MLMLAFNSKAKPQRRTSAGNWALGLHGGQANKCVSPRRQTLCSSNCPTKTLSSSLHLCVFLLCQSPNLLCNGFGEEALDVGCHCGSVSHDRCRSACPLIVSCGSRCHKQWWRLSSSRASLKAKVRWSGPMPEEMRRSGPARLARQKEKHNVCPTIQTQRVISLFLSEVVKRPLLS